MSLPGTATAKRASAPPPPPVQQKRQPPPHSSTESKGGPSPPRPSFPVAAAAVVPRGDIAVSLEKTPAALSASTPPAPSLSPQRGATTSLTFSSSSATIPPVPPGTWYSSPFVSTAGMPITDFHRANRGKVVLSPRCIPVGAAELQSLPHHQPPHLPIYEVGKDFIYGMGYLYNTVVSIEHQWRGRVKHAEEVRKGTAQVPTSIAKLEEGLAALRKSSSEKQAASSSTRASSKNGIAAASPLGKNVPSQSKRPSPATPPSSDPRLTRERSSYVDTMKFERGEGSIFNQPASDLLIGIRLFVGAALVEDHYPSTRSLPQCTATINAPDAAQLWTCVPLVLMGHLNHFAMQPIGLYHRLSLNFVDHLLGLKLPGRPPSATATGKEVVGPPASVPSRLVATQNDIPLRVEIVYGCRAEAYFCTDFIARGSCTIRMTETSKPLLKKYEEQLRDLVRARRTGQQLLLRGPAAPAPPNCASCGHPLRYQCTACGADVCGVMMCARGSVAGYPCGCLEHIIPDAKGGPTP